MTSGSLNVLFCRDTVQKKDYDKEIRDYKFFYEYQKTDISIHTQLMSRFGYSHIGGW